MSAPAPFSAVTASGEWPDRAARCNAVSRSAVRAATSAPARFRRRTSFGSDRSAAASISGVKPFGSATFGSAPFSSNSAAWSGAGAWATASKNGVRPSIPVVSTGIPTARQVDTSSPVATAQNAGLGQSTHFAFG